MREREVLESDLFKVRPKLPEVSHAVKRRLFVEDVLLCIHHDWTVHKVFHPVWSTSWI